MPFIRIFSRQQGGQREAEMVFGNRPIPNVEGLFFFECTIKHAGVSGCELDRRGGESRGRGGMEEGPRRNEGAENAGKGEELQRLGECWR